MKLQELFHVTCNNFVQLSAQSDLEQRLMYGGHEFGRTKGVSQYLTERRSVTQSDLAEVTEIATEIHSGRFALPAREMSLSVIRYATPSVQF